MQKFLKSAVFGAVAVTTVAGSALAADVTMGIRSEPSSVDPYFHNLGPNNAMLGQCVFELGHIEVLFTGISPWFFTEIAMSGFGSEVVFTEISP